MMTSRVATGATFVVAGLLATACAATGEDSLEFQTGLSATDPTLALLAEVTAVCEPAGVSVELVPQTNTYEADMRTRLASNDLPDVWSTHGWSRERYSAFLEPLQDRPWAADLVPSLEPVMLDEDGGLFALPINADIAGIVYNKAVLAELGIEVADLRSWDDFTRALDTLKSAGVTPIGSSSKDSWMAGNITDFMMSGAYDDAALDSLTDGIFDSTGFETVLEEIAGWRDAGYFNPDFSSAGLDDIARSVAVGDTAFVFVQNYFAATVLSFDDEAEIGYLPIPAFVGDPYLVGGEGTAFGVAASSEHKEAALEYLDCLAAPDHLAALAGSVGGAPGLGIVEPDLGALQDSYDEWFGNDTAVDLYPYFDRVYLPGGMWDTMVTTTSAVITGQSDVTAAVDQVQRQYDALSSQ